MQSIAVTHPGLELVAEKEIKELIKPKKTSTENSVVLFEPKNLIDLCALCYRAQSIIKVILLKKSFSFRKIEDITDAAKTIDFSDFITKNTTFMVKCARVGEHDFSSNEVEAGIGGSISGKVNLEVPDIIVYTYIHKNRCYIGIDFSGFNLSKRQYRIFTHKDSMKATMAYCLLRIADYKVDEFLLDPFCGSGTIPIEAALYACSFPINYYSKENFAFRKFECFRKTDFDAFFRKIDSKIKLEAKTSIKGYDAMLGYVKAGQKNAKIAGINKKISLTRADIDWVDTKIDRNKADKIVSNMPEIGEKNRKLAEKLYKEFFYQAEFVLKKKGVIVIAANCPELAEKYSKEYKFRIDRRMKAMQGKKELNIFIIKK